MCKTDKKNSLYSDTYQVRIEIDCKREGTGRLVHELTDRLKSCFALYAPQATCELSKKKYKRGVLSELVYTCIDKEPDNVARFAGMFDIDEWNSHPSTVYTLYPYQKYFAESIRWSRDTSEDRYEIFMSSEITGVYAYSLIRTEKYYPALYDRMSSWICIKCTVHDSSDEIINRILYGLNVLCKKMFPGVEVVCTYISDYWKIENAQEVVFRLIADRQISLEEMSSVAPLTWDFGMENVWIDGEYKGERVSDISWVHYSDEFFITPELLWVHMYEVND